LRITAITSRSPALHRPVPPDPPAKEIRVAQAGDRAPRSSVDFPAGADGFMIGNYLTTSGLDPDDDLRMIGDFGLRIRSNDE
jgi:biotin synthase-like enzyme